MTILLLLKNNFNLKVKSHPSFKHSKLFAVLFFLVATIHMQATTITSNGTGGGNWTLGTSWIGGSAPLAPDSVIVQSGDIIDMNANPGNCAYLAILGTLDFTTARTLNVTGDVMLNNLGSITGSSTGTLSIGGSLNTAAGSETMAGSSVIITISITDSLTVPAASTLSIGHANFIVTGITFLNGTITYTDNTGSKSFGIVTVNPGGTWNCSAVDMPFTLNGNITNNGAFMASLSSIGAGNTYTFTSPTATLNGMITLPQIKATGTGVLTNNGNLTLTDSLYGNGQYIQGIGSYLYWDSPNNIKISTFSPTGTDNTVDYDYAGDQAIKSNVSYVNLNCSTSGTKTLGNNIAVTGNLLIQNLAALDVNALNYSLLLGGNFDITSTAATPFVPENGSVTFDGTSGVQAINTDVVGGETFYNIIFNNTSVSSPNITTNANINVTNNTNFDSGILDLMGNTYLITAGIAVTTDNFISGEIMSSLPGANFTVMGSQLDSNKSTYFAGSPEFQIGTAANGITITDTAGRIQLTNFTEYGPAIFTKTQNTDDVFGGGNYYHGPVLFTATYGASRWRMGDGVTLPDTFVNATFNAFANAGSNNNFIVGANSVGNAFYGTTNISSNTGGGVFMCRDNGGNDTASCTFYGPVNATISFTGNITFADCSSGNHNTNIFDSAITLASTGTSTGFYSFTDANAYGKVMLNPGAYFNVVGGAINGKNYTYLYNITQLGSKTQTFNFSGSTGKLYVGGSSLANTFPCTFNGKCLITGDTAAYFWGSTYNGAAGIEVGSLTSVENNKFNDSLTLTTKSNTTNSTHDGGNTFAGPTIIADSGTAIVEYGSISADDYKSNVTFIEGNPSVLCAIYPSFSKSCTYEGNITANSTNPILFGASAGGVTNIDGNTTQTFSSTGTALPIVSALVMNTTGTLQTNFNLNVTTTLTMTNGLINMNGDTLTLGTSTGNPGTLTYTAGEMYGGAFTRWFNTAVIPMPANTGLFPMGTSTGIYHPFWFANPLALSSGGTMSVTHNPTTTGYTAASFLDATWTPPGGGNTVLGVSNAIWTVATGNGFAVNGTNADIRFGGNGFDPFVLDSMDACLASSAIDVYSASTNANVALEVNRTGLATLDINNPWHIGTDNPCIALPPPVPIVTSNSPLCVGNTLTLMASGSGVGATYSWTGPYGFVSSSADTGILVTIEADSGIYTVTATSPGGCLSPPSTIDITIDSTHVPTASGNSPVCVGSPIDLMAINGGVGALTYSWTGPNGFTSTSASPTIPSAIIADSGMYYVTSSIGGICTSLSDSVDIVVSTATPIAGSNSPVCAGGIINLTASASGSGAVYSWTGPYGFSSNSATPSISPAIFANGGTYSVTATLNSCVSAMQTIIVTVDTTVPPTLGSNSPVCDGHALNLTASGSGVGASYSWTGPYGFTSNSATPTIPSVILADSGVYNATATLAGCLSAPSTIDIAIDSTGIPIATSNALPICAGGFPLDLSASFIAGASYSWTGPYGFTSSSEFPVISPAILAEAGTYSVTATVSGCTGLAGTILITIDSTLPPTASSNSPVCVTSPLNLFAFPNGGGPFAYSWTGPNGFSSGSEFPSIAHPILADSGMYSVTETANGCTSIATMIDVALDSTGAPLPTSNSPLCSNDTLKLMANAVGGSYSWTGPNSFSSALQNPTLIPSIGGIYTLTITTGSCVTAPGTTTVTVYPVAIAISSSPADHTVCIGNPVTLEAYDSLGTSTYTWTGGITNGVPFTPVASAKYVVTGTTVAHGCVDKDSVDVVVNLLPIVGFTPIDDTVCMGSSIALIATGTATIYSWSGGITNGVPFTPSGPASYTVTGTDINGCTNTDSAQIVVNPLPTVSITSLPSSDTVCKGNPITLTATGTAISYAWTGGITNGVQFTPSVSEKYIVTGTGANGCTEEDSVNVQVNELMLKITSSSGIDTLCSKPIILTASGANNYLWNTGSTTDTIIVSSAGGYKVIGNIGLCIDSSFVQIYKFPPLTAVFTATPDTILGGNIVTFLNQSIGSASYFWNFGNNYTSNLTDPVTQYNIPGVYPVYLVTTNHGCIDTARENVYVTEGIASTPPNVFTPNGDGVNDVFYITAGGMQSYDLIIYNRWGQKVFETLNPNIGWDGRSSSGEMEVNGTYYWVVNATDYSGENFNLKGFVQLVR